MQRQSDTRSIHLIANAASGQGAAKEVSRQLVAYCATCGIEPVLYLAQRPSALPAKIRQACRAAKLGGGRVLAMGGDGTIRAVAEVLRGSDVPLSIIPTGTFNFFARNLGIPLDTQAAIELATNGEARRVDIGRVNGHTFVINASFGLYARLIRAREQHTRRFGRHRLVAIISTLLTLLRGFRVMYLRMSDDDQSRVVQSPMVFVGINSLQLRGVALDVEACVNRRRLGVVVMRPADRWALVRLTLRGLLRRLSDEQNLERFCTDKLAIQPDRRRVSVVLDGERIRMRGPLNFSVDRDALHVVAPGDEERE